MKKILYIIIFLILICSVSAEDGFLIDSINVTSADASCNTLSTQVFGDAIGRPTTLIKHPTLDLLYAGMRINTQVFPETLFVIVIDISNPTSPDILSCNNVTDVTTNAGADDGLPNSLRFVEVTGGTDLLVFSSANIGTAGGALNVFNVTNNGQTITNAYSIIGVNGGFYGGHRQPEFTDVIVSAGGRESVGSDGIYRESAGHTAVQILDLSSYSGGGENIYLSSEAYLYNGDSYTMLSMSSVGQFGLKQFNLIYRDSDTLGSNPAITDGIAFNDNTYIAYASDNGINVYDVSTGNFTQVFSNLSLSVDSLDFVLNDTIVYTLDNYMNTIFLDSDVINLESIFYRDNISYGFTTIEILYPYIYTMYNNGTYILFDTYFFNGTIFNTSNTKSPIITNFNPANSLLNVQVNTSKIFNYLITNPETSIYNEKILTTQTCDYNEEIVKTENFESSSYNFTGSNCGGSIPIGVVNGQSFGTGLNTTGCVNHLISSGSAYANNTIVSFDLYTPLGFQDGHAVIDFIQFDGSVIKQLTFNSSTSEITVYDSDGTVLITDVNTAQIGGGVPTRFYFSFNPITSNSDFNGKMLIGTNYFVLQQLAVNPTYDKTFCSLTIAEDEPRFCYIGDNHSVLSAYNNFFGLFIQNGEGSLTIDNVQFKQLNDYSEYTETTDLTQQFNCSYDNVGTKTTRAYISDELFNHNYLGYEDLNIIVGFTPIGVGESVLNSSLTELITDTVAIGGFKNSNDLIFLSLLFILATMIGIGLSVSNPLAGVVLGLMAASIEAILFYFMNWLPTIVMVLIILLSAGLIALVSKSMFGSGGE